MNKFCSVVRSDMKNIRRDPTLLLMLFVPFILLVFLRIVIPIAARYYPEISEFYPAILGLFALLNASFPAFIGSFILLDEKDLKLLPVIKVTPVSLSGFLLARLGYLSAIGFFTGLLIIRVNGFLQLPVTQSIELAFMCMLNAPILLLLMVTLSHNKVEGLTYMKAANMLILIPILILFIQNPLENLLAVLPSFWIFKLLDSPQPHGVFILGTLFLLLYNTLCFRFACRGNG